MAHLRKERYDYFLIWGHGIPYKDEIIRIIRSKRFINILRVMNHRPKSIKKLVRAVYSYDYAPLQHLKEKTRYLLKTDPNVAFIFVHNQDVRESYFGQGAFRHIECERIKSIKEEIRNRFNPSKNGKRTEDHVIHVSDNESQVHHILKYLGFKDGIGLFMNVPNPLLAAPYYLPKFEKFVIKRASSSNLYCNILRGRKESFSLDIVKIENTPHFACLTGDIRAYEEYLAEFRGTLLTKDYSVEKFMKLSQDSFYLSELYSTSYILTREFRQDDYLILDGVHRAAVLKFKGINTFPIAVVKDDVLK